MKLIRRWTATLLQLAPRPLPVGMTAFNKMAERIHTLAGELCTLDDAKFVLSTTIMRFDPGVRYVTDRKFVTILRNAAAKQISAAVFQDVKTRQAEAQAKAEADAKAAEELKQAEATAQTPVASDEQAS